MKQLFLALKNIHEQQYRTAMYESIKNHSRIVIRNINDTSTTLARKAPVGYFLDWHCLTVSHFENDKFEFEVSVHFAPIDRCHATGLLLSKKLPFDFSRETFFEVLDILEKNCTFCPRSLPDDFNPRYSIGNWDCLTKF